MSISVSEVSRFYGAQQALKQVSFNIQSGEVVGFLGPNGAGKSTMMKILTGFLPASSGKITICGQDVTGQSVAFKNKIGYLPEHNPLYLDMYITEYLQFIASVYKITNSRKRVEEMIACTGLGPERHKKIGALSKGYRQRVGLAQALLPDPEVLILDEPTTGLDPNQITGVRDLIKDLGKSKTVLLSTHIMQEVKAICERVIIIHNGSIVADARPDELENLNLKEEQLVEIEFDRTVAPELLISLPGVSLVQETARGWLMASGSPVDLRPTLFHFAVEQNLVILEMKQKQQSLEEVFHALTMNK